MKFKNYLNEIISKEEWRGKYSVHFYQSFDNKKYKKIVSQLTTLFKKLNKGKLKKTIIYDFKNQVPVILNNNDMQVINLLFDLGYTINKDMYKTGICLKNNKEKKVYEILASLAKTNKEKMTDFYKKNPKPEILKQLDAIASLETMHLIKNNKLDISNLSIYKNKEYKIVFTYDHRAIASQSTKTGWTSCMNLDDGCYSENVGGGASDGVFIAYLAKPGDEFTLNSPTARILFKPFEGIFTGNLYWKADKIYGSASSTFLTYAQDIIDSIQGKVPKEKDLYKLTDKTYIDDLENVFTNMDIDKDMTDDELLKVIRKNHVLIKLVKNPSDRLQSEVMKDDKYNIQYINNPSEKTQLNAVKFQGILIQYIKNPSEKVQLEAVKENGQSIKHIKNPSEKVQLEAVKEDSFNIQYIKNPTEKVQLESIKDDETNIKFIKNPTAKVKKLFQN